MLTGRTEKITIGGDVEVATLAALPLLSSCCLSRSLVSARSGLSLLVCWAALALRGQRVRAPHPAKRAWFCAVVALLCATLWHRVAPVMFVGDAGMNPGQCSDAGHAHAVCLGRFRPLYGRNYRLGSNPPGKRISAPMAIV